MFNNNCYGLTIIVMAQFHICGMTSHSLGNNNSLSFCAYDLNHVTRTLRVTTTILVFVVV